MALFEMKFDWWELKLVKKSVKGHLEMRKRGKESFFDSLPVISSKFFLYFLDFVTTLHVSKK